MNRDRSLHAAELIWMLAWVAAGILLLSGLNVTLDGAHGERNVWEILFAFFR